MIVPIWPQQDGRSICRRSRPDANSFHVDSEDHLRPFFFGHSKFPPTEALGSSA